MTGRRDSPGVEPEGEPRPPRGRRFAGLVGSPAARRVALPRLAAAAALALAAFAGLAFGGWKLVGSWASWVDRLPEHRIRLDQVELTPPPDPWVKGGRLKILDQVRGEGRVGETFSLLELDLGAFEKDLRLCPWVKDVERVDRSHYGRLVVKLTYRKPVALVKLDRPPEQVNSYMIDEEAVVLPDDDIDWKSDRSRIRVEGMDAPLVEINGLPPSTPTPRVGVPWKRRVEAGVVDDPDLLVLRAARLARFLQDRRSSLKSPREAPDIASIRLPDKPDGPFYLFDPDRNWVAWGKAAEDEKPGDLTSDRRWAMLLEWARANGPGLPKHPGGLQFGKDGASLVVPKAPRRPVP